MSRKDTIHGAYHEKMGEEIERILKELERIGIPNPTKLEASALIAEKSRMILMSDDQAKDFIRRFRGLI